MNSPSVAIAVEQTAPQSTSHPAASHPAASHPAVSHPIVLQPRRIDPLTKLQADLHQALHQAPTVIVDLIWMDAIDSDTVAVFKDALHLAAQLGKSIAFHGANRDVAMLLAQQNHLRQQNLGHWEPQPESEFDGFLRDRANWLSEAATVPDGEILFPRFGLSSAKTA